MSAFAQFTGAPGGGGVFWPVLWLVGGFGWLPMAGVMARHGRELPGDEAGAGGPDRSPISVKVAGAVSGWAAACW